MTPMASVIPLVLSHAPTLRRLFQNPSANKWTLHRITGAYFERFFGRNFAAIQLLPILRVWRKVRGVGLIKCIDCDGKVSDLATTCPHCGRPMTPRQSATPHVQLDEDSGEKIDDIYQVGQLVKGKVKRLASFGAYIGLEHDMEGLVHISQVSEEPPEKIENVLDVGQEVEVCVIRVDRSDRSIGLSIKCVEQIKKDREQFKKEMEQRNEEEEQRTLRRRSEGEWRSGEDYDWVLLVFLVGGFAIVMTMLGQCNIR